MELSCVNGLTTALHWKVKVRSQIAVATVLIVKGSLSKKTNQCDR
ncbi:MAG: hypothetical protein ACK4ZI_23895 [Microcystis sp.]